MFALLIGHHQRVCLFSDFLEIVKVDGIEAERRRACIGVDLAVVLLRTVGRKLSVGELERKVVVVVVGIEVVNVDMCEDVLQLAVAVVLAPLHRVNLVFRSIYMFRNELPDFGKSFGGGHREGFARPAGRERQGGNNNCHGNFHKSGNHVRMFLCYYPRSERKASNSSSESK